MQRGEGDPRTPMAWQHRDLNYHQSGYQDRYGPVADGRNGGPSSNSDRLSHRTDKSWRDHPTMSPYGTSHPPPHYPPRDYPHSRDLSPSEHFGPPPTQPANGYSHRGAQDSRHSATATSTISSSSSEEDSEQPHHPGHHAAPPVHPAYGYPGYYPGYPPSQMGYAPSVAGGYPGTMKSAKSVPALVAPTYDGEPCPVHHAYPPPGMPMPPPMSLPPMVHPGFATMGPPRKAASIYDMRMLSPPPTIYGTLPPPGPPPPPSAADARSIAGSNIMGPAAPGAPLGIPPQLLPPMARPRPLVIGETGTPEILPVRSAKDKSLGGAALAKALLAAKGDSGSSVDEKLKKPFCCKGGMYVFWIISTVIIIGILLTLMLMFIL